MKQILWFRRDLRINDNAILAHAKDEVLPLFIFDSNILQKLPANDKRVSFIYKSVLSLKQKLQNLGLDLAIVYGNPKDIFEKLLQTQSFDNVLCSCDFDSYAIQRDKDVESLIPIQRYYDSFLIHPNDGVKSDGSAYKVFTPFYKNLRIIWESDTIQQYDSLNNIHNLSLVEYSYDDTPTLEDIGFEKQTLSSFLEQSGSQLLKEFIPKLPNYKHDRDYFFIDATSNLSVHLRFGLISPREIFNTIKAYEGSEFFIRELFWREFYNSILYHFPHSQTQNFNNKNIPWDNDKEKFEAWCQGQTGVPIVDAAMIHLNQTGTMHNRLRMIVASFLCKNLFLPWQWGEEYFSLKLLDYEASSNIGSWQWGASTGADSVPYFRVFNPYSQSEKFDKNNTFINSVLPKNHPTTPIVDIKVSRKRAIDIFKRYS